MKKIVPFSCYTKCSYRQVSEVIYQSENLTLMKKVNIWNRKGYDHFIISKKKEINL